MQNKKVLGLDLGSNSIGWALLEENDGKPSRIIDLGCRIFIKAVEEKTPTPKNAKRRRARLARRILQRRTRRKQRLQNYLIKLDLLPAELQNHPHPELVLNSLGDPYPLRAKGLDHALTAHELGRALLHLVQRRGFLSSRKTLLGDMLDDPDVLAELDALENTDDADDERAKEESAFKHDIAELRAAIVNAGCRTLGEYLAGFDRHQCQRNRSHDGGHLRTDRAMYREELELIWQGQQRHHLVLTDSVKEQIEHIIFYQRPLKLRADRIGKCSLEPKNNRANIARLECQRFRYLQDINNLRYFERHSEQWLPLSEADRQKLVALFEHEAAPSFAKIRKTLGLDKRTEFNLERGNKKLKGNTTACKIRTVLSSAWDGFASEQRQALVEDLLTIQKKSILKKRLMQHWGFDAGIAVKLCLLEFEPGHSNLSSKAIRKLLPYLEQGQLFSEARVSAGYGYEIDVLKPFKKLPQPPEVNNPIVQKALHELRRVVNAVIAEYGKPDAIRVEMARDLEMNTKRYAEHEKQQKANTKANEEAETKFAEIRGQNPHLALSHKASRNDKIKYRLWKDQNHSCAYSGRSISLATLFGPEVEIDHILPYSESLDDSYMNKVVCFTAENRAKGQRTPIDAFGGDSERWNQIAQAISRWDKRMIAKRNRFFMTAAEVQQRDFINSQLNDTRYISRVALDYLKQLGADVSVSKGITTAWVRHQWGLNNLVGDSAEKDRTDHRHHAIDATVVACVDRRFYKALVDNAKDLERRKSQLDPRDIHVDPCWSTLRDDLDHALANMIVSHAPQRKLNGELHEVTGAGFIEGIGNVHRKTLDGGFTQTDKILDPTVKALVERHLARFGGKPKEAFAPGNTVLHKDGKTPIKRVRILQSKTTLEKLQKSKFGVRNRQGDVFKWLAYGNLHHVEILKDKVSGKYFGEFVTMMEASRRVKGIGMERQPIIKIDHGEGNEFVMALHINDIVSIQENGLTRFYRIQKLDAANKRLKLRIHTAATLIDDTETLPDRLSSIDALLNVGLTKYEINAIGKPIL
ncbi:type II CRISPR RNA-guided endonuclease Cas9 [Methylomonas montana]|uniref:type II CRISPR RNA-guided endonuclease Cas9 n=1 Tax=Methylomonas montana TaxID=3058963 RepID=UPI00265874DA|nr:type II CRISPR RNA-guided endonuclease Cas9 [Methylomonas montana]WKJ89623.1 type II CRISPR RNA-guided endonuclease Cas9 [Methylomonas montana]